ncbi:efflux RND transporter periplasmic adaptor subunit [Niveispirillum sp. KHB5.9]|uniref:efflux RND transporter periplasmic adaptor subunit n=1 Tax=Niveispirillum sp. KHB5.9 TaxID=3400269 RepID=UPI003A85A077
MNRIHQTLAAALLIGTIALPASAQQAPPPAARVKVEAASLRQMAPVLQVPGSVMSRQDADVAAEVSGRVTWVAEAGTKVAAGDALARVDDRLLRLELRQYEAQIKSLQSQLTFQERELDRQRQLAERGTATITKLEEANSKRDVLAQDLVRAQASRDRTALEIERTVVKAPFAGQVADRMLELGEYSAPGVKVARLVAVDQVEVRAQAPVSIARHLTEGSEVSLEVEGLATRGKVTRIIAIGEAQSRTFEVRVALPKGEQNWIVGSAVRVGLPSATAEQVVAVHRDALVLRGDGTYLFKVNAQNKAERVAVKTGTSIGDWVQVTGDVHEGDRTVTRGAERLREGQDVELDPKVS